MTHPYATAAYAQSLAHAGDPLAIPEWDSQVLTRKTPCGGRRDATGPYPLAVIAPEADIADGLDRLEDAGLVSVVVVLDDRLRPPLEDIAAAFDFVRPYKSHFIHDRGIGPLQLAKHHRYEVRRALLQVEVAEFDLADQLPAWQALYGQLVARHGLSGVQAFSPAHHQALARLPGLRAFGGFVGGRLVSAHLFVTHHGYAVSHLAASSTEGYARGAAYAVNDFAVAALSDCEAISFGGAAGAGDDPADGLVRFKRGFANRTVTAWLAGKVFDPAAYAALSKGRDDKGYFPAYRGVSLREPANADPG